MKTSELMKRFVPYYGKYWRVMVFDLFCASLTTHSVSIGIVEALQRCACSKKNMQRVYLRIIMLYFYRLKKNSA